MAVEFGPTATTTDAQGRFRLEGFTGETYWIEARGSSEDKKQQRFVPMHSVSRKLSLTESIKNVKLTMSEVGFSGGCGEK